MFSNTFSSVRKSYLKLGQKIGAGINAPSNVQIQLALFVLGVTILSLGLAKGASAQFGDVAAITYNDERISNSVNAMLTYIEGSFGALIMVAAGLVAILSAAFGQYRAALGALIVAVGSFILRSILSTFFNDENIKE